MKTNHLHSFFSARETKQTWSSFFLRWVGLFVMGCCLLCSPLSVEAATKKQLAQQVKKLETFYRLKAWKEVATSALFLTKKKKLKEFPQLYARVYLCLGGVFFHQKQKSLAAKAYQKAFRSFSKQDLPVGSTDAMRSFFSKVKEEVKKERAFFKTAVGKELVMQAPSKASKKSSSAQATGQKGSIHIGWLIGWPLAIAGVGSLVAALGMGINAYSDHTQSVGLFRSAQKKAMIDPLVTPTVLSIRKRAKTYESAANVLYAVGGTLSLAATGLIVWAFLSVPQSQGGLAALPQSTTPKALAQQPSRKVNTHVPNNRFLLKAE